MLECPKCGEPEKERIRARNVQHVIFECMHMVTLPVDKSDMDLRHQLDEWKRAGRLEERLRRADIVLRRYCPYSR